MCQRNPRGAKPSALADLEALWQQMKVKVELSASWLSTEMGPQLHTDSISKMTALSSPVPKKT